MLVNQDSKDFMFGYLIAMRLTDACIYSEGDYGGGRTGRKFDLQAIDKEMVEYTASCLNKVFNRKVNIRLKRRPTKKGNLVFQCSTMVKKIENKLTTKNIKNKEQMKGFVSAFFDAEGNLTEVKRTKIILFIGVDVNLLKELGGFIRVVEPKFDYSIEVNRKAQGRWLTCYRLRLKKGKTKDLFFEVFKPKILRKIKLYGGNQFGR